MERRLHELARLARGRLRQVWTSAGQHPWLAFLSVAIAIPCATLFAVEVRSLPGPIHGIHEWRQGWTYSVAYAFVHESASFFYPKHAWRGNLSGIVGMEAPVYPYVLSVLMRIFGDAPVVGRVLNFGLFVFAFALQAQRLSRFAGFPTTLAYFAMAAFSPVVLCEFRQIQPDPAMTSLAVLAAVYFQDHGRTGTRASFAIGLALYTLSLLTKTIAICILPAMYLFSVMGEKRLTWRGALIRLVPFIIPLALMAGWDHWANLLVQRYMEGNSIISIDHDPAAMWASMKDVAMRRLILLGLIENWATHVSVFPAVLVGIALSFRKQTRAWGVPMFAWLLGIIVISLAFSGRYPSNWYYMLLFVPPCLFFGALSIGALFEVVATRARDPLRVGVAFAVALAAVLVAPMLTELPWERIEHIPEILACHVRHRVSSSELYWIAITGSLLVAGSIVLAYDLVERLPWVALRLGLGAASAWSMVIPFHDMKQTARFYSTESEWESGHKDAREIRRAVKRYSKPSDLFLMNGWNPALLVRAHRVGYADDPSTIERLGPAHYVANGVRFFMNFYDTGPVPASMQGAKLLERGDRWALYCIDPKGCPRLRK